MKCLRIVWALLIAQPLLLAAFADSPPISVTLKQHQIGPAMKRGDFKMKLTPTRSGMEVSVSLELNDGKETRGRFQLQPERRDNDLVFHLRRMDAMFVGKDRSALVISARDTATGKSLGILRVPLDDAEPLATNPKQLGDVGESSNVPSDSQLTPKHSWERFKVGDRPPLMMGMAADGSYYDIEKANVGKVVLVGYWSAKDEGYEETLRTIERVFQRHGDRPDFRIITFWTDHEDDYLEEMKRRGSKFFGRQKYWPLAHPHSDTADTDNSRISDQDIRTGGTPVFLILDRNFKVQHVDVPTDKIERTVDTILNVEN